MAFSYILQIIELFKKNEFDEVFRIIKDNNIDPQYSDNIIADYAALWVEDKHIVRVFKKIKEIGGEPTGHKTIINNLVRLGKLKGANYLINEGVLEENKDDIVYIINNAAMSSDLSSVKLLRKHLDITQYKLLNESNPSIVNRSFEKTNKKLCDYLFKENIIQPYIFSNEVISQLERNSLEQNYKNYFIKKVVNYVGLKDHKKYISEEKYKPGDIAAIFKVIQYDSLNKELKMNENPSKKAMKL